jgi:hypothetical protein
MRTLGRLLTAPLVLAAAGPPALAGAPPGEPDRFAANFVAGTVCCPCAVVAGLLVLLGLVLRKLGQAAERDEPPGGDAPVGRR